MKGSTLLLVGLGAWLLLQKQAQAQANVPGLVVDAQGNPTGVNINGQVINLAAFTNGSTPTGINLPYPVQAY